MCNIATDWQSHSYPLKNIQKNMYLGFFYLFRYSCCAVWIFLMSIFMAFPVVEAERHVSRLAVPDPAHACRAGAHSPVFCQVYRPKGSFPKPYPCKICTIMHMYGRYRNRAMDTFYNFINKNIFYEFSTSFRSLHCSFKEAINSMYWCSLFFMPFLIGLRASLFP